MASASGDPARAADPTCPVCEYNLTGLTGGVCPECGWTIDDAFLEAFRAAGGRAEGGGSRRVAVIGACLLVPLLGVIGAASLLDVDAAAFEFGVAQAVTLSAFALGAGGQVVIALLAFRSRRVWPIRNGEARRALWAAGLLAVALGVGGAAAALKPAATPAAARRTGDSPGMEFILRSMLFSLPGVYLLIMTAVAFYDRRSVQARAGRWLERAAEEESRASFAVMAFGRFHYDDLTTFWTDASRSTTPDIERDIARAWERHSAAAEAAGRVLYNGALARLAAVRHAEGRLHFELGATCYRDFLGTNLENAERLRPLGDAFLANPVGISTTPITADGAIVYGRRNDAVAFHAGFLHTFGGAVEPADRGPGGAYDLFHAAMRELCEELAIAPDEVEELVCTGIVRDETLLQPEVLFDATLKLTRRQVLARFDPAAAGQEHARLECCFDAPDEIVPFLHAGDPVAPICEGALLLHGRHAWGEDWYQQACLLRFGRAPRHDP